VGEAGSPLRDELGAHLEGIGAALDRANAAREIGLPACRRVIRESGSAIRAVHRLLPDDAERHRAAAEGELRTAQEALGPFPAVAHAGFLHDAEKEYAEAVTTIALVEGSPLPGPGDLDVSPTAWMRGLAEGASELRRHLLDRLRDGDLARGESLLATMDDVYDLLLTVDYPDAVTNGLRRTLDQLRAVLERSRGDVTTTVLQTRLQRAIESGPDLA
jgi:translin